MVSARPPGPGAFARRAAHSVRRRWRERRDPVEQLHRRGLLDLDFYAAQLPPGTVGSAAEALRHYREHGRAAGLAVNPFLEPEWFVGRSDAGPDNALALERALVDGRFVGSPSPLLADDPAWTADTLAALAAVVASPDAALAGGLGVRDVRSRLIEAARSGVRTPAADGASGVDWVRVRARRADRVAGRVSVVVATYEDWRMTVDAVRAALRTAPGADLEVVVVDNGSRPSVRRLLTALLVDEPAVTVIHSTVNTNFSGAMNIGIERSSGEYLLLLNNDAMLQAGWLPPLLESLEDPAVRGVQSLLLYPASGRVQAAGTMFLGEGALPWHFLAGHPVEDAVRADGMPFRAITAAVMMVRAADLIDVGGFDEGYRNGYEDVDLCLRLATAPDHRFLVAHRSRAEHPEGSSEGRYRHDVHNRVRFLDSWRGRMPEPEGWRYAAVGMRLVGQRPWAFLQEVPIELADPQLVRVASTVQSGPATGAPRLRWTLALTATADPAAVSLLRADLDELGQEVVSFSDRVAAADALDDVLVALSPDAPFAPRSGAFSVLLGEDGSSRSWDRVVDGASWSVAVPAATRHDTLLALLRDAAAVQRARFGDPRNRGS